MDLALAFTITGLKIIVDLAYIKLNIPKCQYNFTITVFIVGDVTNRMLAYNKAAGIA